MRLRERMKATPAAESRIVPSRGMRVSSGPVVGNAAFAAVSVAAAAVVVADVAADADVSVVDVEELLCVAATSAVDSDC